ncbi:Uncharacterised protein [Providencia rettgeri]|uniref:hypothetical protein n=1 Tax=Providencia rettgeri TaxID=587 RepID=UPI001EF68BF7|nr:hypothetical protein [Providencia rettgeri]CAB5587365.1 Uncharacterised protein [Providencia rettgeri]CAC9124665.1 Uncharacterised protein [Providencia rettgeri]
MAKTAAERKAEQRKRQKDSGEMKFELIVDSQELEMLRQNCALRRPGREPYDMNEYKQLSNECCGKCGESLPVAECCLSGAADCWNTKGWHELSLSKIGVTCHEIKS